MVLKNSTQHLHLGPESLLVGHGHLFSLGQANIKQECWILTVLDTFQYTLVRLGRANIVAIAPDRFRTSTVLQSKNSEAFSSAAAE